MSDRRSSLRGPATSRARLTLLDGSNASHDILTREQPSVGISFMLHQPLLVGQVCDIAFEGGRRMRGEVVRARPISGNRWEMAVQLR